MPAANGSGAGGGAGAGASVGASAEAANAPLANSVAMGPEPRVRRAGPELGEPETQSAINKTVGVMERRARSFGENAEKSAEPAIRELLGGKKGVWVEADVLDYRRGHDRPRLQEAVATRIGENARADPEYQRLLREQDPALAEIARQAAERQRAAETARARAQQTLEAHYIVAGNEYRFRSEPTRVAFREEGRRFTTEFDTPEVARGIVDAMQVRGARAMTVAGSEEFRRNVWREAEIRGMTVRGYTPTPQDREYARDAASGNVVTRRDDRRPELAPGEAPREPREASRPSRPPTEQIVAMGAAHYKHDKQEDWSYYIRLRDGSGNQREVWGKDLERAALAARVGPGDAVRLQVKTQTPVEVEGNVRNAEDKVIGRAVKASQRNEWQIEKVDVAREAPGRVLDQVLEKRGASSELRDRVGAAVDSEMTRRVADGRETPVQVLDASAARQVERPVRVVEAVRAPDRGSPGRG